MTDVATVDEGASTEASRLAEKVRRARAAATDEGDQTFVAALDRLPILATELADLERRRQAALDERTQLVLVLDTRLSQSATGFVWEGAGELGSQEIAAAKSLVGYVLGEARKKGRTGP